MIDKRGSIVEDVSMSIFTKPRGLVSTPRSSILFAIMLLAGLALGGHRCVQAADDAVFARVARPFFAKHCLGCHGKDLQEGEIALHQLDATQLTKKDAVVWGKIVEVLKFRQMPPADEPQPTAAEIDELTGWVQPQLKAAGLELDVDHKLKQPSYANLLSHEKLFDGSVTGPAFSPPRLWRIHPEAYENVLKSFGGQLTQGGPLSKPFNVGDGKGEASNYADLTNADSATLGQLLLNCKQIARYQTFGFKKLEKDRRSGEMVEKHIVKLPESFKVIVDSDTDATPAQRAAAVEEEFRLILGRSPTADEAKSYEDLLQRAMGIGGKLAGLRTMATAVLLRPEAIYRMEVGLGEVDEHGRRLLSPYELAYAISYALTDLPPDQLLLGPPRPNDRNRKPQPPSLLDLAGQGKLQTRADVREVVTKIWQHESLDKTRVLRFFQEFFGYHTADTIFKGDRANRAFATKFLVSDADELVLHIVRRDRDVLKELLTTDRYFIQWPGSVSEYERRVDYIVQRNNNTQRKDVNYKYFVERAAAGLRPIPQANPTWRQTVRFYNIDERTWDYPLEQPLPMPSGQRVGLLTHPAWLVAWSGNFENDPIRRGKWIREHLLAGSIPDIPITVNAAIPEDPHKTLRQRLEVTRADYCWRCHQRMNPLGMPFEAFTDFGRFRTEEGLGETHALGKPKRTAPVVTAGEIIKSGEPALDGKVKDVHELMQRLSNSPRVRQSFVRHAFRYWMGRNEMLTDSPTLIAADKAYIENSGSFKALVVELLVSDSFLYRKSP